jgi:hypothetical protein
LSGDISGRTSALSKRAGFNSASLALETFLFSFQYMGLQFFGSTIYSTSGTFELIGELS